MFFKAFRIFELVLIHIFLFYHAEQSIFKIFDQNFFEIIQTLITINLLMMNLQNYLIYYLFIY